TSSRSRRSTSPSSTSCRSKGGSISYGNSCASHVLPPPVFGKRANAEMPMAWALDACLRLAVDLWLSHGGSGRHDLFSRPRLFCLDPGACRPRADQEMGCARGACCHGLLSHCL